MRRSSASCVGLSSWEYAVDWGVYVVTAERNCLDTLSVRAMCCPWCLVLCPLTPNPSILN
jgi:hypothetical protein